MADVFVTSAGVEVVRRQTVDARVTSGGVEVVRQYRGTVRVTAAGVEVVRPDQPAETLEMSSIGVQVVHDNTGDFDMILSQEGAEPIIGGEDIPDVTQEGVEPIIGGPDIPDITQEGVEVIWRGEVFGGCESGSVFYRVRLRLPGDTVDLAQFTSLPTGDNSVLISAPRIDAASIDVLRGETTIGGCTVQLADPEAGTCTTPDLTDRAFTKWLADSAGQSQLLGARLYIEATDNPAPAEEDWLAYWGGYVAAIRYVDAITVELSGSHSTRDDETTMVWKEKTPAFSRTGHLMGGPTLDDWPSSKIGPRLVDNEGDWVARVTSVNATYVELDIDEDASAGFTNSGEGRAFPPLDVRPFLKDRGFFIGSNNDQQRNIFAWAQRNAQPYFAEGGIDSATAAAWKAAGTEGWFPRLACRIVLNETTSAMVNEEFPVMATQKTFKIESGSVQEVRSNLYEDLGNKFRLYWPSTSPEPQPAVNNVLRFYTRALDVSEANPLLIAMHPVDILTALWDELDIDYDAGAAASVKAALGDFIVALRITEPKSLKDAQTMLCGGFGIGWRYAPNGMRYLFTTRVRPTLSGTITLADLISDNGVVWENEESSRVFSTSYKWTRFEKWPGKEDGKNADRALDGIMPYDVGPITFQTGDIGTKPFGARDEQYEIPGSVYELADGDSAPNWTVADHVDITANLTAPLLDQFARGGIKTTLDLNHCVLVQEGEDWELELPHRPGFDDTLTPVAQRGLVERVQCISRTPQVWGSTVTLIRVPQVDGGVVPPPPADSRTAELLDLSFVVHDATATGGNSLTSADLDETFVAYPYFNSFLLATFDNTHYDVVGASVLVESYEGATAPPTDGLQTRYPNAWDGLNAIEVGGFSASALVWYRTQVRVESEPYVGAWSAWASVQLSGTTQAGVPTISLTPDGSWNIDAEVVAPPTTVRLYIAADTTNYPTEAATLLETPVAGNTASLAALIPTLPEAETAYVTAIAEDIFGNRSIVSTSFFTRPGGGSGGGGGGSPIYTKYDPFCPPAVPSALDDEFTVDQTGTPAGWTLGAGAGVIAVRRGSLVITSENNGAYAPTAIEKTLPSGPFTVVTHFTNLGKFTFHNCELGVRNATSLRAMSLRDYVGTSGDTRFHATAILKFTNSYAAEGSGAGEVGSYGPSQFYRICYDGTTIYLDRSHDGSEWDTVFSEAIGTHFTGGDLPNRVYLCGEARNATGHKSSFSFFRYAPVAFADLGRMVGVGSDGALVDPLALYLHNRVI